MGDKKQKVGKTLYQLPRCYTSLITFFFPVLVLIGSNANVQPLIAGRAQTVHSKSQKVDPNQGCLVLFTDSTVSYEQESTTSMPAVMRSRIAELRSNFWSEVSWREADVLRFNLFEDLILDAVITKRIMRLPSSYSWFGEIISEDLGTFGLAVEENVLIANLNVPGKGEYQIRYLSNNLYEIREVDESMYPQCGGGIEIMHPDEIETEGIAKQESYDAILSSNDDGSEFDVMVVYTPKARDHIGGTAATIAAIYLMVDQTNVAYQHSQIFPMVRLVYHGEINYNDYGDSYVDISRLRSNGDGYMDEVHGLRNTYGADMVCLINARGIIEPCGLGYLMQSLSSGFASWAFSWVGDDCIGHTFAHELGHNMGSHHAVGDSGLSRGEGLYNYSHGWRWYGDSGTQFRSIMAYSPGSLAPHFSNPNILYDGQPTGRVDLEDNTRSINNAALTVANWRQATVAHVPPTAEDDIVFLQPGIATTIELKAQDDSHPNPPAAMTYVITSLPQKGTLDDPCAGRIETVPYSLLDNGNQVIYTSVPDLVCPDMMTFVADDSGVQPQAGQSNVATVQLKLGGDIYSADMDTNPGWHTPKRWAWGVPIEPDCCPAYSYPTSGYTGNNVIAYNLTGNYTNKMRSTSYATTPVIDCQGYENIVLTFYRWLWVYASDEDHANIEISIDGSNWIEIWHNGESKIKDTAWKYMEYDISAIADNQQTLQIRWGMGPTSDFGYYPGWYLDDIRVSGAVIPQPRVGDFGSDCRVNLYDFATLALAWLSNPGDENWNPICDISIPPDDVIDEYDLKVFTNNWLAGNE